MGAWGHNPWDNDTAADLCLGLKSFPVHIVIEKGLNSPDYDVNLMAALLVAQINLPYVYSLQRSYDHLRSAIDVCEKILADEEWLATWRDPDKKRNIVLAVLNTLRQGKDEGIFVAWLNDPRALTNHEGSEGTAEPVKPDPECSKVGDIDVTTNSREPMMAGKMSDHTKARLFLYTILLLLVVLCIVIMPSCGMVRSRDGKAVTVLGWVAFSDGQASTEIGAGKGMENNLSHPRSSTFSNRSVAASSVFGEDN